MMFPIIKRIPEKMIPRFLMNPVGKIFNQAHQSGKAGSNYEYMHLQKAVDDISNRHQAQK